MAYQSEIEKLEQRYHENPQQWFAALADSYRKVGDLDLALEVVRGGLEKRPNYASGHIVLGRCLLDKQQPDEAALSFEQVLELDAENIIALKSLGDIAEQKGDFTRAKQWLARLLDIDPMNSEARESLDRIGDAETAVPEEEEPAESEDAAADEGAPEPPPIEPGAAWAAEAMAGIDRGEPESAEPAAVGEDITGDASAVEPEPPVEEPLVAEQTPMEAEAPPVADEGLAIERTSWDDSQGAAALEPPSEDLEGVFGGEFGAESEDEPVAIEPIEGLEVVAGETVEAVDTVETVETVESTEPPEGGQVRLAGDLEVVSFDEELSWDAGDQQSAAISHEDVLEAEGHHEDVAPAVEFLGDPEAVAAREESEADGGGEEGEGDGAEMEVPVETALVAEPVAEEEPAAPVVLERPAVVLGLDDYPEVGGEEGEEDRAEPLAEAESAESVEVFEATERGEVLETADTSEPEEPVLPAVSDEAAWAAVPDEAGWADEPDESEEPVESDWAAAPAVPEASSDFAESDDLHLIMPEDVTPQAQEAGEMEPVVTETMAEVYAKQGLYEQARETYEKLLQQRPGDLVLEQKLAEIPQAVDTQAASDTSSRFSISATGGESAVAFLQNIFQTGTAVEVGLVEQQVEVHEHTYEAPEEPEVVAELAEQIEPVEPTPSAEPAEQIEPVEPTPSAEPAASEEEEASVLESAFGGEPDEPPGSPTIPASDEVSLSSVFGSEPPAPHAGASSDGDSSGGMGSVSFDEFYGAAKANPEEEEPAPPKEEDDESSDDDFRNWLEGLKT